MTTLRNPESISFLACVIRISTRTDYSWSRYQVRNSNILLRAKAVCLSRELGSARPFVMRLVSLLSGRLECILRIVHTYDGKKESEVTLAQLNNLFFRTSNSLIVFNQSSTIKTDRSLKIKKNKDEQNKYANTAAHELFPRATVILAIRIATTEKTGRVIRTDIPYRMHVMFIRRRVVVRIPKKSMSIPSDEWTSAVYCNVSASFIHGCCSIYAFGGASKF